MATALDLVLAALPLAVVAYLLIGRLWPATKATPVAWGVAVVVALVGWSMPVNWVAAASIVGIMTAVSILWIVFGALLLLYTLVQTGAFDAINRGFADISDDRRVQIVVLAFLLTTFIEGAAGFGTPAAVVAPLLLGLGFPALAAVVSAIIGHIVAVTYGAVGTPINIGIQQPMTDVAAANQAIVNAGMTPQEFSFEVATWAATYHALVGFAMPFFAVAMVVYFFGGEERSIAPAIEVLPLCLFAGLSFAVPYWLAATVDPTFPSLFGSLVAMVVVIGALKLGYFVPDTTWDFPPREDWPSHWVGEIEPGTEADLADDANPGSTMPLWKAWAPYGILVVLLVVTRVVDPVVDFLNNTFVISWTGIFGTSLDSSITVLYLPGTWLVVSALAAIPLYRMNGDQIQGAVRETGERIVAPVIALVCIIAMVQVMLQSGAHADGVDSMIVVLAQFTANVVGPAYPFVAAFIGAFGAFLVGSNTVSNLTFSPFQFEAATQLELSRQIIVGAQAVGGAIGNLIAIHNVVAALATVGLVGKEGRVIRLNLIPLVYYGISVGLLALLFSYVLFPNLF